MAEVQQLLDGLSFGESLRWHQDRLWLADWGAQEIVAVDREGRPEVMARVDFPAFPMCIDWLPDGRLLIVAARDGRLLRQEPDGSLVTHADLSGLAEPGYPWNEIVVDGRGNAYLNNQGFDFPGGKFAPGTIALVTPDGSARPVARDRVPQRHGHNARQLHADRGRVLRPEADGIPDRRRRQPVPTAGVGRPRRRRAGRHLPRCRGSHLVRRRSQQAVRAGPRGRPGAADDPAGPRLLLVRTRRPNRTTLFMVATQWRGTEPMTDKSRTGQLLTAQAPAGSAGRPAPAAIAGRQRGLAVS